MKELFSKRAKKIITAVSLSCFLCSPVSYVYSMNQASAAALNIRPFLAKRRGASRAA